MRVEPRRVPPSPAAGSLPERLLTSLPRRPGGRAPASPPNTTDAPASFMRSNSADQVERPLADFGRLNAGTSLLRDNWLNTAPDGPACFGSRLCCQIAPVTMTTLSRPAFDRMVLSGTQRLIGLVFRSLQTNMASCQWLDWHAANRAWLAASPIARLPKAGSPVPPDQCGFALTSAPDYTSEPRQCALRLRVRLARCGGTHRGLLRRPRLICIARHYAISRTWPGWASLYRRVALTACRAKRAVNASTKTHVGEPTDRSQR